jgi:hypothetical protein
MALRTFDEHTNPFYVGDIEKYGSRCQYARIRFTGSEDPVKRSQDYIRSRFGKLANGSIVGAA